MVVTSLDDFAMKPSLRLPMDKIKSWKDEEEYISPEEFEILSSFIYHKSGIKLETAKTYLLNNRVQKRIRELGFKAAAEYIRFLKYSDKNGNEFQELLNLITVNETYFFRDFPQLEAFVECLKVLVDKKVEKNDYTLKIWSAGCSSGEEAYTLGIILHEILGNVKDWRISILGSDIDKTILQKAQKGKYDFRSVKDSPSEYMDMYFDFQPGEKTYNVKNFIRNMVEFEHLNLNDKDRMRMKRNFDFIFCRNVLIYFDDESRRRVVEHFYSALNESGYIFLGSSESMGRITSAFKLIRLNKYLVYCKE
jgi:chemotaxis protein methyltransferase CheR